MKKFVLKPFTRRTLEWMQERYPGKKRAAKVKSNDTVIMLHENKCVSAYNDNGLSCERCVKNWE